MNTSISLDSDKKSHSCETPNKRSPESAETGDPKQILKHLRLKNVSGLICAQLNINSIRNIFDLLVNIINNSIDILMISETKLDPSSNGGGILLHIREDIPSKLILTKMTIEGYSVEINLRRKKVAPMLLIYSKKAFDIRTFERN